MGRKKSTCVQYFELTKDEQMKCEKAKCRFCGWVSAKNTVRMKIHLAKHCTGCPEQVKREYHEQIEEDVTESTSQEDTNEDTDEEPNDNSRLSEKRKKPSPQKSPRKKKKRKAVSDRSFLIEENKEVDRALADYLFSANLPLSTVENPFFVQFCKKLKPTYDLPSRHRIVSQNFLQGAQPFQMNYLNPGFALNLPMQTTPNHQPSSSSAETPSASSSFLATPPPQFHGTGQIQLPTGVSQNQVYPLQLPNHPLPTVINSSGEQQPAAFQLIRITNP